MSWSKQAITNTSTPPSDSLSYVIELDRWGIESGIPSKPYITDDYIKADANILGIHNAINWAAENGFSYIVLPKNDYSFCWSGRTIIVTQSNITIDFNQSNCKIIHDSDKRHPFDTRTSGTDYWNYPQNTGGSGLGVFLRLHGVSNTHICNLNIIGDKADRSFSTGVGAGQGYEVALESSYGIILSRGSNGCTIKNCKLSSFMGDGISIENSSGTEMVEFSLGLTVNDIDRTSGALIAATGSTVVSQFINLPAGYNSFLVAGQGVTRQTNITDKQVGIFFYAEDNSFISRYENKKIYTPINIPSNARKVRFLFYNESNVNKIIQWTLKFGLTPHHNLIEKCEVYNIHRGGITLGGNYNTIQYCTIHNGTGILDKKPLFNDPTRFGINQEDSYGDNCIIRNNVFYDLSHGVLLGCFTVELHNNHFYNCGGNAINLYSLQYASVRDNYIFKCATGIGLMSAHLGEAYAIIKGNMLVSVTNGGDWDGDGSYDGIFEENIFIDNTSSFYPPHEFFVYRNNHYKWTSYYLGNVPVITIDKVENCTFECTGSSQREINFRCADVVNCSFVNLSVKTESRNSNIRETCKFTGSKFINSRVVNHVDNAKAKKIIYEKCKFVDSIVKWGNINTPLESTATLITDSEFVVNTNNYIFLAEHNTGFGHTRVERSRFSLNTSSFQYLLSSLFPTQSDTLSLFLIDSVFEYTGAGRLNLVYYNPSAKNPIKEFVSARNEFIKINLPSEETGIYLGYDPDSEGINEPSKGYWTRRKTYGNATLTVGTHMGWVCISEGYACNIAWSSSTPKVVGDRIYEGTSVYEVTVAGTTGTTAPTWSHTQGVTIADGTVTWTRIGNLAVFKQYGQIST